MQYQKVQIIAAGVVVGILSACGLLALSSSSASAKVASVMESTDRAVAPPSEYMLEIAQDAEAAKQPRERQALVSRMMELHNRGQITTPADCAIASKVLMSSAKPGDRKLAHEYALVALSKGVPGSAVVAAQTYDRLLVSLGESARFGTTGSPSDSDQAIARLLGVDREFTPVGPSPTPASGLAIPQTSAD